MLEWRVVHCLEWMAAGLVKVVTAGDLETLGQKPVRQRSCAAEQIDDTGYGPGGDWTMGLRHAFP